MQHRTCIFSRFPPFFLQFLSSFSTRQFDVFFGQKYNKKCQKRNLKKESDVCCCQARSKKKTGREITAAARYAGYKRSGSNLRFLYIRSLFLPGKIEKKRARRIRLPLGVARRRPPQFDNNIIAEKCQTVYFFCITKPYFRRILIAPDAKEKSEISGS